MTRLLVRASRRYALRHPLQLFLAVLGVSLGVAVVVSIDMANESARRAFSLSMDAVVGRATHQVLGGPDGVDAELYRRLRVELGLRESAPVVETSAALPGEPPRVLRVLGVDPFAEAPFRARLGGMFEGGVEVEDFLVEPRRAVLSASTARELGLAPGDELTLRTGTRLVTLTLVGLLEAASEREQQALGDLLVMDVAAAQEVFELGDRLTRIDLLLPEGEEGARRRAALEALLPAGTRLVSAEGRTEAMASMTRAFRLNLRALSLLALVVGMFLIYNAMTFAVVQRRQVFGRLRALGVTRAELGALILVEAALIGAAGTLVGLLLGALLAQGLVRLVTQTINDLYFLLTVRELFVAPASLAKGVLLGVGASVLSAIPPALEAAGATPRRAMERAALEERWRRALPALTLSGLALTLLGAAALAAAGRGLPLAFAGIFGLIVGVAALAPIATLALMRALAPLLRRASGVIGAMAARGVVSSLSRSGIAVAALMTAVSVTVGVGIMIDSFRGTVVRWLENTLVADVYISPPELSVGLDEARLAPGLVARLASLEGVRATASVFRTELPRAEGAGEELALVIGADPEVRPGYQLLEGGLEELWPRFASGEGVLVSEPFSSRTGLGRGDRVRLLGGEGAVALEILGVYYDYATERGVVAMHRRAYARHFGEPGTSGLGLFTAEGTSVEELITRVRAATAAGEEVLVQSNRAIREEAMRIFDRTFAITAVLRALAVLVAFVGVASALLALELERAREHGVLRANGMTPGQLRVLVFSQTGLIGLAAGLFSLPVGLMLAWLMVHVINRRSFGWSLEMSVDPWLLAQALAVAIAASLVAGAWPSLRMARTSPAVALRAE